MELYRPARSSTTSRLGLAKCTYPAAAGANKDHLTGILPRIITFHRAAPSSPPKLRTVFRREPRKKAVAQAFFGTPEVVTVAL